MSLHSEAVDWIDLGLKVLPVHRDTKKLVKGFNASVTLTKQQVIRFFSQLGFNICLVTGQSVEGQYLAVLDFDSFAAYRASGVVCDTRMVESTRGYHLYYWIKDKPPDANRLDYQYAEIKTLGKRIMLPPSVVNSNQYQVVSDKPIKTVDSIFDIANPIIILPDRARTITPLNFSAKTVYTGHSVIQAIKNNLRVTDIFSPVYPSGNGYALTHCPMPVHKRGDVNPSLSLNLVTNRVRCFKPGCPLCGDVIDVYRTLNGLDLRQALYIMARESRI